MRKKRAVKRDVAPDPVYNSKEITKLINQIMFSGKKGPAQKILYSAFDMIKDKTKQEPLEIYEKAMKNINPILEVKSRRVGGANYQVPMEVAEYRSKALGRRWLIQNSRERHEKTMSERLANELIDAANGTGGAVKKREDVHKAAEANKAFAHYRW